MRKAPIGVGIIGCGMISRIYLETLTRSEKVVKVVACADLVREKAEAAVRDFHGVEVLSVPELLKHEQVDIVLNLTVPGAHYEVAQSAIEANKSVYSEKPIALSVRESKELVLGARERGVLLGCAPDTFMGGGLQGSRDLLDSGEAGDPIGAQAFMLSHGPEDWHENPDFYYAPGGGPMFDMGPYYLTALVSLLGPVRAVMGGTKKSFEERVAKSERHMGRHIPVFVPTHVIGILEFANGVLGTITTSFDVWKASVPFIEVFGSERTLSLPDPNHFGGATRVGRGGNDWQAVEPRHAYTENSRGVGVLDMALALLEGRPHRASGEMALHVVEIMEAIHDSAREGRRVELQTSCDRPQAMPHAGLEA